MKRVNQIPEIGFSKDTRYNVSPKYDYYQYPFYKVKPFPIGYILNTSLLNHEYEHPPQVNFFCFSQYFYNSIFKGVIVNRKVLEMSGKLLALTIFAQTRIVSKAKCLANKRENEYSINRC